MKQKRNSKLTPLAQRLRREMTKEERHLWYDFLKGLDVNVNRQYVIGGYIADFYISSHKIVIELDGGQHYSPEGIDYDKERDAFMESSGLTVLRFSNLDVNQNFSGVCDKILYVMKKLTD